MDAAARMAALRSLAVALERRREELVESIVETTKRTRALAQGEVELALRRLRAFDEIVPLLEGRSPVGTVAVVFPGNAALSNPAAAIGTAFLAGNRVVARFPGALRSWSRQLEPLFAAHLPGVAFKHGPGAEFLYGVLADPKVAVVLVFGDDGWALTYEAVVRAQRKKFIFEGPGKDPFLVLPGADVERAAEAAVRGGYFNAGQACTSPERFYVHRELLEVFVERVVELTGRQVVGEPARADVTVGPIVGRRVVERISAQLRDARARGARLLAGGVIRDARLADGTAVSFVEPSVLTDVSSEMAVMREETFGPVLPIQAVDSEAEAIDLAAASPYGLAASVFGGCEEHAAALETTHGCVFRDEIWLDYYKRNLHAPYGGRKRSGWVWATEDGRFVKRDGARANALEFTRAN